jgi:hypothetical protein
MENASMFLIFTLQDLFNSKKRAHFGHLLLFACLPKKIERSTIPIPKIGNPFGSVETQSPTFV